MTNLSVPFFGTTRLFSPPNNLHLETDASRKNNLSRFFYMSYPVPQKLENAGKNIEKCWKNARRKWTFSNQSLVQTIFTRCLLRFLSFSRKNFFWEFRKGERKEKDISRTKKHTWSHEKENVRSSTLIPHMKITHYAEKANRIFDLLIFRFNLQAYWSSC